MSIISKETFDMFAEEEKAKVRKEYLSDKNNKNDRYFEGSIDTFEELFGKENLQPEPKIKTWKDVEKIEGGKISVDSKVITPNGRAWGLNIKYHNKAEATLKLAILIELGYGGMVKEEENSDREKDKFIIAPIEEDDGSIGFEIYSVSFAVDRVIAFHTIEQAEEFMSYPENRTLIEQYYMI